jgi:hypothetical protein
MAGSFEVKNSLLKHILFGIMHSQTRDYVNLSRVVSIALLVVVNSLELILFLLVEIPHLSKDFRVSGDFGNKDVVPL